MCSGIDTKGHWLGGKSITYAYSARSTAWCAMTSTGSFSRSSSKITGSRRWMTSWYDSPRG